MFPCGQSPPKPRPGALHQLPPLKALLSQANALISALSLPSKSMGSTPLAPIAVTPLSTDSWLAHPDDAAHTVKGVWLPHAWMDEAELRAKAAKADKAALPLHLWTRRIALALEAPTRSLPTLWDWQFRRVCCSAARGARHTPLLGVASLDRLMVDDQGRLAISRRPPRSLTKIYWWDPLLWTSISTDLGGNGRDLLFCSGAGRRLIPFERPATDFQFGSEASYHGTNDGNGPWPQTWPSV
jgi:hypothetical protein